ncbi:retinitis pigmentosa 1-like 1 protein isoform X2 [Etheostoma cragini]|uniref:retinitis pigmentosa 1-like 1 protein isoform X2 n=1 Tax=Etheostoma cragini TaxID=417921 RepID=UPI00155E937E|nr:retinitis pigmentosa 1-like 1 protein isoform X2 [Etheostoma cragini]
MYSVEAGMWDPQPPSKHASSLSPRPPSNLRPAHVIAAPPAKRITFYKSGDSQFEGVKMAIQKRSFKCFDTLLDDLSQKVPLPFGVRTVTTPRGTHAIKHLEQLQDGGCYLCSDRRQAKPVNMELAGKRPTIWYHHSRRPQQPESSSGTPPGHQSYRQRRILLVKNSEPGMRRSVVLSRRSTRSLKSFLDEVSEVMQFHVRKLYTAEGRRIDSVQNLMTCPGTLVCVGREAFSPLLINFIRKSSEEKLPGLGSRGPALGPRTPGNGARSPATQGARSPPRGAQSRASEYSEGQESRKNANFGLETKKSIIHPRSDSSNRSTRFSLSSEKSYSNGFSAYSQARPAIMNDDIEKRVLVNKDGSLSVEMRVRFRLHNDETLQWSTQLKKSPSLTNECCPLSQAQPHYLQQCQSESCSDPDSTSFDPEGVDYSNQPAQCLLEGNQCPCCYQRQEQQYDLWENPAHSQKQHPVPPPHPPSHSHTLLRHTHSSSSSSSCNSRRVVRCRERITNCGTGSKQSQLVQEEMFVTEQVERRVELEKNGDTHVEVCRMSRCCSRSEMVAFDSKLRPLSRKSVEDDLLMGEDGDRPLSAISSSSHILQSLQEDQDDDLPPSASQCCQCNEPCPSPTSQTHLSNKPTSSVAAGSVHSTEHKKQEEERESKTVSVASSCQCGAATPHSTAEAEGMDRAPSSKSKTSRASSRSSKVRIPNSEEEGAADDEDEDVQRVVSGLSGRTGCSLQSRGSNICPNCGGCKSGVNSESNSRASQRSMHSHRASPMQATPLSSQENANNGSDDDGSENSVGSTKSNKNNLTNNGRCSAISNIQEHRASSAMSRMSHPEEAGKEEERALSATSATSHRSNRSCKSGYNDSPCGTEQKDRSPSAISAQSNKSGRSHKSNYSCTAGEPDIKTTEEAKEANTEERALSSLSAKSGASAETSASVKKGTKVASPPDNTAVEDDDTNKRTSSALSDTPGEAERSDSVMSAKSAKSYVSAKSGTSHRSICIHCARAVFQADVPVIEATEQEEEMESEERAASAMSGKSNLSAKSNKSHKSIKAGEDGEERAASQASCRLVKSKIFHKNDNETAASPSSKEKENEQGEDEQPESVISAKSAKDTAKTQVDNIEDRTPSTMSSKSHISAKSSKSQKSNQTTASPNPNEADMPSIEINGKEEHNENQERVASALSVKSKSSIKSHTSQKSSKNLKLVSPSPNVVTFQPPEGVDEDENEKTERAQSAASAKSEKSSVSTSSHKSRHKRSADFAVIKRADADENVEENSTKSTSHGQTLLPRGSCSPLTHSPKAASPSRSSRSGRSKYGCGAASALEKSKEEKEGEKKEDPEELEDKEASEQDSILSSSSRRHSRESGGTEQPLSRNSSGSVSLGLPEDQEIADSDSGKSCVSFHTNTEKKGRVKTVTPDVPKSSEQSALKEEREETGSITSQKSSSKSAHNHIPTFKTTGGSRDKGEEGGKQTTERGASSLSKSSKSNKSSCSCGNKAPQTLDSKSKQHTSASPTKAGNDPETASLKSASTTKASKMYANDNRTSSAMLAASAKGRSKSPASASAENTNVARDSGDNAAAIQAISRPASKAEWEEDNADNKAAGVQSKSPCSLRPDSAVSTHSDSKMKASKQSKAKSSTGPSSKVETFSGSTLHHSTSAADMLKETMAAAAAARSNSQQSMASKTSDKSRSKRSQRSRNQTDQEELELSPACLPNASPNEVVSDWLRSIPANSCMLALGDGLNEEEQEKVEEEKPGEEEAKEEGNLEEGKVEDKKEGVEANKEEQKEEEAEFDAAEEEKSPDSAPGGGDAAGTLPKSWHSSVAVMKVLLSSSPGRCHSMPEVSPVYGRRLSTSARGFLDCLAQLQLIEPKGTPGFDQEKDRNQQYEDIMAILQSLWLTVTRDIATKETKDVGTEQVTPPRSSSGVGMSSGSGGSGKENGTQGGDETNQNKTKESSLHEGEEGGAEKVVEEEEKGNAEAEHKETEAEPEETEVADEEVQSTVPPILDSPKVSENPLSLEKSSANNSSKSPTDNEQETAEDSGSSGTPPTVLRAPLSKRLSQDPDPVWVLNLLKKLEKQFMDHYINAMAEFKVRWDLDDNLMLDTMIGELREEVSRRIQSSVEREVRKIQSRAGRGGKFPRPPQRPDLSRESTVTEKRRQILKVMKKKSVKTADCLSDEDMTAEFSDQRSDDEYCPCDACVRKKMAARPLQANPLAAKAPVMMEFDLLKILQLKKTPAPAVVLQSAEMEIDCDSEGRNLEVVQEEEEEEETKEDIKAKVVLEETIPEEDEETGNDGGEAGDDEEEEEEAEQEESIAGGEDQEEKETAGEEPGEEETSGNEEEEAECQCQCARNEEESDKAEDGEEETAEEEAAEETRDNAAEDETGDDEERTGEEQGENKEDGETGTEKEEDEEEEEEEDGEVDKRENGVLFHQFTRTSVESQPGSLEDIDTESPNNLVNSTEVPKRAACVCGGVWTGQRRSRSPGRVKRSKPKECDVELN